MKTIFIAHNYTENSFAYMSFSLAQYLSNRGNRVVFISHRPYFEKPFMEDVSDGELIVYSWPAEGRPTKFRDVFWFAKLYMKYKPTTVISHFVNVNITIIVSKVLSLGKVKTLPYYHTLSSQISTDSNKRKIVRSVLKMRKKFLYRFFSNSIICPSDFAKEDLLTYFGQKNGLKILNPMKDRFIQKEILSEKEIIIVYLGRIDASKGVIDMINAFNSYCLKKPDTIIRIKIAGSGSQREEAIGLMKQNCNITYAGGLTYNQVDSYLSNAHFTIIPSKFDNLPTVGLESLMNKTPLLISYTTGLTQELTDGFECVKFDPNVESMVSLFGNIENMGIHTQQILESNARKTFLEKFSVKSYFHSIESII